MVPSAVTPQETRSEELVMRLQTHLSQRFRGVRIDAQDGGLVLCGRVPTYYMKQVAQELVMGATDVPILRNEIEVH